MTGFWDHGRGMLSPPDEENPPGKYGIQVNFRYQDDGEWVDDQDLFIITLRNPEDDKEVDEKVTEAVLEDGEINEICEDVDQAIKDGRIWWDSMDLELFEADDEPDWNDHWEDF